MRRRRICRIKVVRKTEIDEVSLRVDSAGEVAISLTISRMVLSGPLTQRAFHNRLHVPISTFLLFYNLYVNLFGTYL